MLSKSQIRLVTSLKQKKFRHQHGAFLVEGTKSVQEFLRSDYQILSLYYLPGTLTKVGKIPENTELFEVTEQDLKKISQLTTPQDILALVKIPSFSQLDTLETLQVSHQFALVLDEIQDPGNLGTIIRTADWFGIHYIFCSHGTVDAYNPKTVQATMGSLSRLHVMYVDLPLLFEQLKLPVFGAVLDGQSIFQTDFGHEGLILLGNEGHGISVNHRPYIDQGVTIPRLGGAESLNVAISTALFCAEVVRRS